VAFPGIGALDVGAARRSLAADHCPASWSNSPV
jgi:hypothetical protein